MSLERIPTNSSDNSPDLEAAENVIQLEKLHNGGDEPTIVFFDKTISSDALHRDLHGHVTVAAAGSSEHQTVTDAAVQKPPRAGWRDARLSLIAREETKEFSGNSHSTPTSIDVLHKFKRELKQSSDSDEKILPEEQVSPQKPSQVVDDLDNELVKLVNPAEVLRPSAIQRVKGINLGISRRIKVIEDLEIIIRKSLAVCIKLDAMGAANTHLPGEYVAFMHRDTKVITREISQKYFQDVREILDVPNRALLKSLCASGELAGGESRGKSGSFFFFSADHNFIMKSVSNSELSLLRKFMPEYVQHLQKYPDSLIPRFLGCIEVVTSSYTYRFLIQNNVFITDKPLAEVFDLKGSTQGRFVPENKRTASAILKDLDFLSLRGHLNVDNDSKHDMLAQMRADVELLEKFNIMDYSMLVGIHKMDSIDPLSVGNKVQRPPVSSEELARVSSTSSGKVVREPSKSPLKKGLGRMFTIPNLLAGISAEKSPDRVKSLQQSNSTSQTPANSPEKVPSALSSSPSQKSPPPIVEPRTSAIVNGRVFHEHSDSGQQEVDFKSLSNQVVVSPDLVDDSEEEDAELMTRASSKVLLYSQWQSFQGGLLSRSPDGAPLPEIYFIGIIDILQLYNVSKRIESAAKSIQHGMASISSVNPQVYGDRFLGFMEAVLEPTSTASRSSQE